MVWVLIRSFCANLFVLNFIISIVEGLADQGEEMEIREELGLEPVINPQVWLINFHLFKKHI